MDGFTDVTDIIRLFRRWGAGAGGNAWRSLPSGRRNLSLMEYAAPSSLPVGASIDLQYRLPPPQQILLTPTIIVSIVLLGIALVVVVYLAYRGRVKAKKEARIEAIRMAEKILLKRGGTSEDVDRMLFIFRSHRDLDPAAMVMIKDRFHADLRPLLEVTFDKNFGERMEKIFFPPPKDTRRALAAQDKDVKAVVEEQKATASNQTAAAIMDLMDATLKPGVLTRLAFEGLEGGYECIVMGHDMQSVNVTLPAHNDQLVASLKPGMRIEGTLESGPSLMAFTSAVIQAVAGSMPYCRITSWKSAWEVRKRDSLRLPISLDIDFQHISTASADSIKMSNLEKEIGTIRPGKLMDVSLGGCCIETPSSAQFRVGDMLRFSKSLVPGNPPATLLGALVRIDSIDPAINDGSTQRLHIQFLVIDDVSQRILVRTLRQLQDLMDRDDWMKAQQLLQKMRRNRIQNIGSPAGSAYAPRRGDTTSAYAAAGSGREGKKGTTRPGTRAYAKPSTRSLPSVPPARGGSGSGRTSAAARPGSNRKPPSTGLNRPTRTGDSNRAPGSNRTRPSDETHGS